MPTSDMDTAGDSWISSRFALIFSILIGTLLVAALISVLPSRTRAGTQEVLQYRTDHSPEAVVHNGYVALQRNDMNRYIPLFELERWQLLRRQEDHILYGRQEEGQIGIKLVDSTVTGTTAYVTVATLHTGGTFPKYPRSGFFAMRLFRTETWRVDVEQVDGKWKLALRLPESRS